MTPARVVAAAALALLAGCGVRLQEQPEPVPPAQQPTLGAGSVVEDQPVEAVVYLVEGGRLVRDRLPAASQAPDDALQALLSLTTPQGARRTAVPAGTRLLSTGRDGDLVAVDLDRRFAEVRGPDQLLAVAQVVFTVTERPPARRVRLTVEGADLPLPTDAGVSVREPVTRDAFSSLAPP